MEKKKKVASSDERRQLQYLSSRIITECRDILDDSDAVLMLFSVIEFMNRMYKKKAISVERAGKLYNGMIKDSMPTAERIFKLYMDDYLTYFDGVGIEAINYASTSRYVPDYVSDENFQLREQIAHEPKKQDRERYFRLRERMVAECGNLLDDYEAMEIIFNIVNFMWRKLSHGRGLKLNKETMGWKKKFMVWRMKRQYLHKMHKVIPIAKWIFMFLFKEYIVNRNQRAKNAYVSATSRLIYTSDGWE